MPAPRSCDDVAEDDEWTSGPLIRPDTPVAVGCTLGHGLPCNNEADGLQWLHDLTYTDANDDEVRLTDTGVPFDDGTPSTPSGEGDRVGGWANFVQAPATTQHPGRAAALLVQLDAESAARLATWGDEGSAQLFGDPAAVARGDLSSLWWDWTC